jgi:hypothetical protein
MNKPPFKTHDRPRAKPKNYHSIQRMKENIEATYYHRITKIKCQLLYRNAGFWIGEIEIPSAIFYMTNTPKQIRILPQTQFDKNFVPEFS